MKSLDLSHFKKMSEDQKSATLMHPQGHKIVVAKSALSKKMRDTLAAMPQHMADGGEVPTQNLTPDYGEGAEGAAAQGWGQVGRGIVNAISDKSLPPGQDQIEPSWDPMDIVPPEKMALGAVGLGKLLAAKTAAAKGATMLPGLAAGAIRRTATGKLLGTVGEEAAMAGEGAIKRDLLNQARSEGMQGLKGATTAVKRSTPITEMEELPEGVAGDISTAPSASARAQRQGILNRVKARFTEPSEIKKVDSAIAEARDLNEPYGAIEGGKLGKVPNYDASPTGAIGNPRVFGSNDPDKIFAHDPFGWVDQKFGASKHLLEKHAEAGMPVTVTTASDLIAHDDYIKAMPEGSTVNLVIANHMGDHPEYGPGSRAILPSPSRIMKAYERLKDAGINVNLVTPDIKSKRLVPVNPFIKRQLGIKAGLKGYADGGVIEDTGQDEGQQDQLDIPGTDVASQNQAPGISSQDVAPQDAEQEPQSVPQNMPLPAPENTQRAPAAGAGLVPGASPDYIKALTHGMAQQRQGVQELGQAQAEQAKSQVEAANTYAAQSQQFLEQSKKDYDQLKGHIDATVADINNGQIDPHHYMESKSGFSKVATAIGLILGGIGAGLTGQKNAALEFLNQNIDRDIESQRAQLGKKQSLLSAYMQQMGGLQSAQAMTKSTMLEKYKTDLMKAAAQSGSAEAMARAKIAAGQIEQQQQQILIPLTMQQSARAAVQSGSLPPEAAVRYMVPKEQQAAAFKEIENNKEVNLLRNEVVNSIHHINQGFLNGTLSPADTESAKMAFTGKLIKLTEGRFNQEAAMNLANAIFPTRTESQQTTNNKIQRANSLFDSLQQSSILSGYGIPVEKSVVPTPGKYRR